MRYFAFLSFFCFPVSITYAQIPVEKDPFHKIVFENESVRVLDLSVGKNDTTTDHIHSAASVVVFVTESSLAIQAPGTEPVITKVEPGEVIYRAYDETPVTHKVWSDDGSIMRCIVIELKKSSTNKNKSIKK